jgi:hypothetical protein
MRCFLISMPPDSMASNVPMLLHLVGEAFIPLTDAIANGCIPPNLVNTRRSQECESFNHGVSMILSSPGENAPHQFKYQARVASCCLSSAIL